MNKEYIFPDGSKDAGGASERRWSLFSWLRNLRSQRGRHHGSSGAKAKPRRARLSKRKAGDIYPLY